MKPNAVRMNSLLEFRHTQYFTISINRVDVAVNSIHLLLELLEELIAVNSRCKLIGLDCIAENVFVWRL